MAVLNVPSVVAFHDINSRAKFIQCLAQYWANPKLDAYLINPDCLNQIERFANEIIEKVAHIRNQ